MGAVDDGPGSNATDWLDGRALLECTLHRLELDRCRVSSPTPTGTHDAVAPPMGLNVPHVQHSRVEEFDGPPGEQFVTREWVAGDQLVDGPEDLAQAAQVGAPRQDERASQAPGVWLIVRKPVRLKEQVRKFVHGRRGDPFLAARAVDDQVPAAARTALGVRPLARLASNDPRAEGGDDLPWVREVPKIAGIQQICGEPLYVGEPHPRIDGETEGRLTLLWKFVAEVRFALAALARGGRCRVLSARHVGDEQTVE